MGTPKIYTTTGFGLRKNKKMVGVNHLLVYMQIGVKQNTFYFHLPGGAQRPRGGVYTNCSILQQFAYTPRNCLHQPFSYFFQAQTRWWIIYMGSVWNTYTLCKIHVIISTCASQSLRDCIILGTWSGSSIILWIEH